MPQIPGIIKPELQMLPQIRDRLTFLYLERCQISRDEGAITVTDEKGVVHIPAAMISTLILGPGTSISHRAVELIGDAGVGMIWSGEMGVRYYASGRPLTHHTRLLLKQAEKVSNTRLHLDVVRAMYQMRFPNEDVSRLTMQQLRGREGARVRAVYRAASQQWDVPWNGRLYRPDDFQAGDPVNQALSAGHVCLYGLAHAVITALGCSPGLGFVHVGHDCSFVYDIADLYKAELSIPVAFEMASKNLGDELASAVRRRMRDEMMEKHVLERMVHDIQQLLLDGDEDEKIVDSEVVYLWDNDRKLLANGISYGQTQEE